MRDKLIIWPPEPAAPRLHLEIETLKDGVFFQIWSNGHPMQTFMMPFEIAADVGRVLVRHGTEGYST